MIKQILNRNKPITIAIFGKGQLGEHVFHYLINNYDKCLPEIYSHSEVDIFNDKDKIKKIISEHDVIINCAAYTNVDSAEQHTDVCLNVNADAVEYLAKCCYKLNKRLIHISSDFVYGNISYKYINEPLIEDEILNPINFYGYSKMMGEFNVLKWMTNNFLILRVSWTFGRNKNFVSSIVNQLIDPNKKELVVVCDQLGKPTSVSLISKVIVKYIDKKLSDGVYNLQNSGEIISKFHLAKYIKRYIGSHKKIRAVKTDNSGNVYAKRQFNSHLNCNKIDEYCKDIRVNWIDDLNDYLDYLIKKNNIKSNGIINKLLKMIGVK